VGKQASNQTHNRHHNHTATTNNQSTTQVACDQHSQFASQAHTSDPDTATQHLMVSSFFALLSLCLPRTVLPTCFRHVGWTPSTIRLTVTLMERAGKATQPRAEAKDKNNVFVHDGRPHSTNANHTHKTQ
jgi:hypothetical protein